MRTSILSAAILGLFAAGCAGELSGTGENGGDDTPPVNCGNGTMDPGETCDDGNTTSGDGCSSSCTNENSTTPKVNVSVDKPTVMTELNKNAMLTVTLTGEGGFNETVNLTGTAVDGTGTAIPGWTVMFNNASVAVPNNGSATAVATVHVPSDSAALTADVKIQVTSSLGTTDATPTAFTVLNQITFDVPNNGGQCVYPAGLNQANPVKIKVGSKFRIVNKFAPGVTANNLITIHFNGTDGATGQTLHEPDPGHTIDAAYERTITPGTSATLQWYCHAPALDPGAANRPTFSVVP